MLFDGILSVRPIHRVSVALAFGLLCAVAGVANFGRPAEAATYTVTTTADAGPGSLRQAILDANTHLGADTIEFDIAPGGAATISPLTSLPDITDPVVVDGTTQPGYVGTPLIELAGAHVGGYGLYVTAGDTTIRGLVINRFDLGIGLATNGRDVVEGNFIGTNVAGTAIANSTLPFLGGDGIVVTTSGNRIGGTSAASRNVIAGFSRGIELDGNPGGNSYAVTSNVIEGNFIGLNATGDSALPNRDGILVYYGAFGNLIGGTDAAAGNVISGNDYTGIFSDSGDLTVQGNLIGTDSTGTRAIGNTHGVFLLLGSASLIGGATGSARNVISGNLAQGVFVGDDRNRIQGNFIGTQIDGGSPLRREWRLL